jgi:cell division protease FtsH
MSGGMTIYLPQDDKAYMSKKEMLERMVAGLGGRVAEQLVLDDISTGASNDIKEVTKTARKMVTKYGMSDKVGPVNYSGEHDEVFLGRDYGHARNYSEDMAAKIDDEIKGFISQAYKRCEEILKSHMEVLHKIADYLLENETMDAETFESYFAKAAEA